MLIIPIAVTFLQEVGKTFWPNIIWHCSGMHPWRQWPIKVTISLWWALHPQPVMTWHNKREMYACSFRHDSCKNRVSMSLVNCSIEGTWWNSRTQVVVWKPNCAQQKTDWHARNTACDSALGVRFQQQVPMAWVDIYDLCSRWTDKLVSLEKSVTFHLCIPVFRKILIMSVNFMLKAVFGYLVLSFRSEIIFITLLL
jgi:hypothetical protein